VIRPLGCVALLLTTAGLPAKAGIWPKTRTFL